MSDEELGRLVDQLYTIASVAVEQALTKKRRPGVAEEMGKAHTEEQCPEPTDEARSGPARAGSSRASDNRRTRRRK
jgi:hypothetical protein